MKTRLTLAGLLAAGLLAAQDQPVGPVPDATVVPPEQLLSIPTPGRFRNLFLPFRTDTAALSPDGKYLAYSVREGDTLSVVVLEIDHPETIKVRVQVSNDEAATPMLNIEQREKTPGRVNWMRWVTPTRLAVETNQVFTRTIKTPNGVVWQNWHGAVLAFDADGANARQIAGPDDVPEMIPPAGGFSVRRNTSLKFNPRVVLPDEPTPAPGQSPDPFNGDFPTPEAASDNIPPTALAVVLPRNLRIFDLDAARPGAVTVVAAGGTRDTGNRLLSFLSLDVGTGKLTDLADGFVLATCDPRLDRQGRIRLTLPNSLLSSFPLRYDYLGPKGRNRPQPLDEAAGLAGFSVSPDNYFGERAIPLGFDEDPNLLYYAANIGRDTFGIYSLDLATKERGRLTMENPAYDLIGPPAAGFPDQRSLVFDRFERKLIGVRYENALRTTAWLRPEWRALQADFEKTFPGRSVEIADWDEAGRRFIVTTEGPADPGAFFIYDRDKNKLIEFVRRAPWIDANQTHLTLPFSYAAKDGARVSGLVTSPRQPRLKPIPMVVLCPDLPWQRVHSDFQTEVQALAEMGFVVVQLNGRGAWGLGLRQRQSLTAGYDLVQIEDITTTVANLEKLVNVTPGRVALMGRGHGGFIALRTLQTHPDRFRCAIALDAPVNLADWLTMRRWSEEDVLPHLTRAWLGDAARLQAAPLAGHPETVTKPVLMLNYPGPDGAPRRADYAAARRFAGAVRRHGATVEFDDLRTDYVNGLPEARAAVFDRIEEFLNVHIYDFNVKLREMKIIK